jgi:hypothetical protein
MTTTSARLIAKLEEKKNTARVIVRLQPHILGMPMELVY